MLDMQEDPWYVVAWWEILNIAYRSVRKMVRSLDSTIWENKQMNKSADNQGSLMGNLSSFCPVTDTSSSLFFRCTESLERRSRSIHVHEATFQVPIVFECLIATLVQL